MKVILYFIFFQAEQKHTVVLNLWKQKYEELLMEKAEIEHKLSELESQEVDRMADLDKRHQEELDRKMIQIEIQEADFEKRLQESENKLIAEHQVELQNQQQQVNIILNLIALVIMGYMFCDGS